MWRSYGAEIKQHVHLTWDKVEPHLGNFAAERAQWYRDVDERMRLLNAQEKAMRNTVKLAQALLEGNG
jgi:hypothetical protein